MKEIKNIIAAYDAAAKIGKESVLATVVHVEGSSYRRSGARMLVAEDGVLTGAISGGCLEGDALRKALLALSQGKSKLVVYDTTNEEDAKIGVQLGCNGIVSILFEPLLINDEHNPVEILRSAILNRKPAVFMTGYAVDHQVHLGTRRPENLDQDIRVKANEICNKVIANKLSAEAVWMTEGQPQHFFIEYYQPPISLLVVGAGNDTLPLVAMADLLGWHCTVVDGRLSHATRQRFPGVEKIVIGKPAEVMDKITVDQRTAIVLMTHNYNYDQEILALLSQYAAGYIGLLGPKSKHERMLAELGDKGIVFNADAMQRLYGPTGLDLGAETAEEIALSITAEIMAVMQQRRPIHLNQKNRPIHQPDL